MSVSEGGGVDGAPSLFALAMDSLLADIDGLVELLDNRELDGLDAAALVGFAQEFERVRNRLPMIDHRVILALDAADTATAFGQPNVGKVVAQALRISPAEAGRRIAAAKAVGPRTSMLGEELAPIRPLLRAAQAAGDVTPDRVALIVTSLAAVDRAGFDPQGRGIPIQTGR